MLLHALGESRLTKSRKPRERWRPFQARSAALVSAPNVFSLCFCMFSQNEMVFKTKQRTFHDKWNFNEVRILLFTWKFTSNWSHPFIYIICIFVHLFVYTYFGITPELGGHNKCCMPFKSLNYWLSVLLQKDLGDLWFTIQPLRKEREGWSQKMDGGGTKGVQGKPSRDYRGCFSQGSQRKGWWDCRNTGRFVSAGGEGGGPLPHLTPKLRCWAVIGHVLLEDRNSPALLCLPTAFNTRTSFQPLSLNT